MSEARVVLWVVLIVLCVYLNAPLVKARACGPNGCLRYRYYCRYRCWKLGCRYTCSPKNALPGGTSRNAGTTRANYIPRYSSDSPQRRNKGLKDASSAMPRAVEQAMTSLMKQLQREADIANSITVQPTLYIEDGRKRPFRMVQKFLKAKPIAKHMSMPAFIITNASAILMEELGMAGGDSNNMAILQSMGSPLSANTHLLAPDEPFPIPEAGSCPWPRYACRGNVPYRSFDGSCNNLQNPLWGRSFTPVTRFLPPQYGDDIQSFRRARDGSELPGARKVSFSINEDRDSPHHIHSAMLLQFGQFLDHDMTLTAISKIPSDPTGMGETVDIECGEDGCATHLDACKPIIIPHNDPDFHTEKCLEFVRSQGVPNLKCSMGPIQQLNQLTAYIDGSNVYGSTKQENDKLRHPDKRRGMLRWMDHPSGGKHKYMLPTTSEDSECNEFQQSPCFLAGDERVNEQNALTAMHTIWFREHNWIEKHLHHINPQWGGDKLFQETRKIIGAMLQHIAFNEFLPIVLGPIQMERLQLKLQEQGHYNGYDATVNAGIASSFATAAYRFGHSLLIPKFHRLDENYKTMASLHLSQILFRPHRLMDTGGVDSFMRGLCETKVQTVDRFITKEATTKLFSEQPPSGLGTDLVSLNIQRGRDHGVPGYNAFREWCGMPRARDFNDLTEIKDPAVRVKFRKLYKHVDDIDLFPAGLSEAPVEGGLVGPTFACIIGRQFRNLRKGDRHWYENPGPSGFSIGQLAEIKKVRLARVVCRNGDAMGQVQPSVMLLPFREAYPNGIPHGGQHGLNTEWFSQLYASDFNAHVNCSCLPDLDLTKWKQ